MLITKLPQRPFPLFINPNQTGFVKGCYSGASAALLKRGSWVKGKGKGSRVRVKGEGQGYRVEVPITPKYFFSLNKSLHLFEMNCAFLN